jgi:hypothetical protein
MKTGSDPLAIVRESRIRMSHEANNDPVRVIAVLRKRETKYARQIEKYRLSHARVAEERVEYGKKSIAKA